MGGERRTSREIRLTGLGTSLQDRIDDLKGLSAIVRTQEDREEINRLVQYLENGREACHSFCRAWSRTFDVED
jgi:hypothetical protein